MSQASILSSTSVFLPIEREVSFCFLTSGWLNTILYKISFTRLDHGMTKKHLHFSYNPKVFKSTELHKTSVYGRPKFDWFWEHCSMPLLHKQVRLPQFASSLLVSWLRLALPARSALPLIKKLQNLNCIFTITTEFFKSSKILYTWIPGARPHQYGR